MNDESKLRKELSKEITELRRQLTETEIVVQNLRTAQAHLSGIVEIASEAIISVDERQQIIFFNKGAQKMFHYELAEVIGQPLNILLPQRFATAHHRHITDFSHSKATARLMGERDEILGLRKTGEEFPAEASISKLEVDGKKIFTVVLRDITHRKQAESARKNLIGELQLLNEAARMITAELSLSQVLQKITWAAQILLQVKYAALGIYDGQSHLSQFVAAGLDPAEQARIGALPIGRGLLGKLLHQGQSLIVENISQHPDAIGFPKHHPKMQQLLGVPIYSKDTLIGALYLADKEDGSNFSETDQHLVEMLSLHAATAIDNARLYEHTERLAILEERERFARDLHDGIIQSIYGVGLSLQSVKADIPAADWVVEEQLELSLKSLAKVIDDLRRYIFDLRPQALTQKGLKTRLGSLIEELKVNVRLPIQAEICSDIDTYLNEQQARHVFHISHEALSNAARHAKANNIFLSLAREAETITLQVKDDGAGFILPPKINPGHRGLANIQSRAALLGAKLNIDTSLNHGTSLTLVFRTGKQSIL